MSLLCRVGIHDWYESPQGVFCSRCGRQMLLDGEISSTNAAHIYATEVDSWQPGQIVLEEFRVERELGKGGMGIVYLLVNTHNGQQFAAKRTKLVDDKARKEFLREMQGWLDLPPHPHVLPLRFLRTMGEEQVIFTEHMNGGSLQDWLRKRKLSDLATVLDVAIQYAWGLHALHELGQVHQDVKPGNALLDKTGVLKVADFGLMRARHYGGIAQSTANGDGTVGDVQATHAGNYTPAYCSPEQARGEKLTKHTDTWSWGLSVLAMFYRTNPTDTGPTAFRALAKLAALPTTKHLALPKAVAAVLNRCFQDNPADRWHSLLDAANTLVELYPTLCGQPYPRPQPTFIAAHERLQVQHDRRTASGGEWVDPRVYLEEALRADGKDTAEAEQMIAAQASSRKGQAAGDLMLYDTAYQILNRLVQSGHSELQQRLAELFCNKAMIHLYLDDQSGYVDMFARATTIYRLLVEQEGKQELSLSFATALNAYALALQHTKQLAKAVEFYNQAIAIRQPWVEKVGRWELEPGLAEVFLNKGNLLQEMGQLPQSLASYDQALTIYQRLVKQYGGWELEVSLADVLINKGNTLNKMGKLSQSLDSEGKGIVIFQRLIENEKRRELEPRYAIALSNQGGTLRQMGQLPEALASHDLALSVLQRLVQQDGRLELEPSLADTMQNKGNVLLHMRQLPQAVVVYDQVIVVYQRLVNQEGRQELELLLARVFMNKGTALSMMDQQFQFKSLESYDSAITIHQRLVDRGQREWIGEWAMCMVGRALLLMEQGKTNQARADARRAIPVLEQEVARTGRSDLQQLLNAARQILPQ